MKKPISVALSLLMLLPALCAVSCGKTEEDRTMYEIEAEYFPETRTLSAQMTVDVLCPGEEELSSLSFELWPNAYREGAQIAPVSELFTASAYYDGPSYGGIEITAVEGARSFTICGEDKNILRLSLSEPLPAGQRTTVGIAFEVVLAKINHRLGVTRNTVNLGGFYPVLCHFGEDGFEEYVYAPSGDPFVSDTADYDVTLTLPKGWKAISGFAPERVESLATDQKEAYHVRAEGVRDVAFVLGKSFEEIKTEAGGVEVVYAYFGDPAPEETLACAAKSLAFYADTFGAYAYPRYCVAETDFVYGGMEYPALSMIASGLHASEMPAVVAHETAHQWWYAMVGSNQFEHAWQDEGLAEYSSALFFEAHPAYQLTYADCIAASERAYRAFFSVHSQVTGSSDTGMDRPLTEFSGDYEYRSIAYDKGVILFDRIRETIGKKRLIAALGAYASAYSGKLAAPHDLIGCFARAGGNAAALFASFREGSVVI